MRREAVPRQCFPFDKMVDVNIVTHEETYLGFELIGLPRIVGQHQQRYIDIHGKFGRRESGTCPDQPAPAAAVSGLRHDQRRRNEEGVRSHKRRCWNHGSRLSHKKTPGQIPARASDDVL